MATRHEIRHDRIAKRVFEQASAEQLGRRRVKRLVEDKMFQSTERSKEINKIAAEMETDDGFLGRTWRFNHKLLGWLSYAAAFLPFLLPISYLLDYFHKNKASFARQFLLAPDELALVDRYKKDIQWEDPKLVNDYIETSQQTLKVKNLFYTSLGVIGVALIALAAFFWWQNQQKEKELNERLADYYAQVAETKIGQDSLQLAYRLNKEALRLHPTDARILRQDSFLQRAVPDFSFRDYSEFSVHYPFVFYCTESSSAKDLKILHIPSLTIQTLTKNSKLQGFRQNEEYARQFPSQSGNFISWIEDNELKVARRQLDGKSYKEIAYSMGTELENLTVLNAKFDLLALRYSIDEKHLYFLYDLGDSLLISCAQLTENSIGRPQRIHTIPIPLKHNYLNFAFCTSENNETYLSLQVPETGSTTVFKLSPDQIIPVTSMKFAPLSEMDGIPKLKTTPNGKGLVFSEDGRFQILFFGTKPYLKELKLYRGSPYDYYNNYEPMAISQGENLVTLHLNFNKEFVITCFGEEGAREFQTGVHLQIDAQKSAQRRPKISFNDKGTLLCVSTKMGSLSAFSIRPDTVLSFQYDFVPAWSRNDDDLHKYFYLGSDSLLVHLNQSGGYNAIIAGANGFRKIEGKLSSKILYTNEAQLNIYEESTDETVLIKKIDPVINSLKTIDTIPLGSYSRLSFHSFFGQPNLLTQFWNYDHQYYHEDYLNLNVTFENRTRNNYNKFSSPTLTVLDSAGTYVLIKSKIGLFIADIDLLKLLTNPTDLPAHLANNPHLNTWRPGEKERYGIKD
ncbi:hypothetical protein [Neolewinella persica]|uniref:hypothetical protein n=1 Tax=Neolewinella persica TaxID=70998 RepID=UPI00037473C6|nr:hypothetical protein [Neolewinella persica]